jgi:hypothetical protein
MNYGLGQARGLGRGLGRGCGHGLGFAFRGWAPEWPYIGRGRGGQPRCAYYTRGAGRGLNRTYPQADATATRQDEIGRLKDQAEALKQQLGSIEARLQQMQAGQD